MVECGAAGPQESPAGGCAWRLCRHAHPPGRLRGTPRGYLAPQAPISDKVYYPTAVRKEAENHSYISPGNRSVLICLDAIPIVLRTRLHESTIDCGPEI